VGNDLRGAENFGALEGLMVVQTDHHGSGASAIYAMGGGENPVLGDQGAAAKMAAAVLQGNHEREFALNGFFPAYDIVRETRFGLGAENENGSGDNGN
jgi:hypothetical protein